METLKKRVGLIEKRWREDVALLREEFVTELSKLRVSQQTKRLSNFTNIGNSEKSTNHYLIHSLLEQVEKDMITKFAQIQDGFHSEKRWRRDVQQQLLLDQQKIGRVLSDIGDKVISQLGEFSLKSINSTIIEILREIKEYKFGSVEKPAIDCRDLYRRGHVASGVYEVFPSAMWRPLHVFCDMETDGGGWTVFQRRCDGSENFFRSWNDYSFGFGNLSAEFWLGNEYVFRLISNIPQELRIELEDFENDRRFAKYSLFEIGSVSDRYKLKIEDFDGNVTDSMIGFHNNKQFSTFDKGTSAACAKQYKGGFWYGRCHKVNINGLYHNGQHESYADGINWYGFRGYHYSLKFTEMKFRSK